MEVTRSPMLSGPWRVGRKDDGRCRSAGLPRTRPGNPGVLTGRVGRGAGPASVRNAVARATVPTLTTSTRPMPQGLRPLLRGAQDEASVARALLRSPDPLAWAWAVANVPETVLKDVARHRGLNAEARLMVHRTLAESMSSTNGSSSSGVTPT